MLSKKIDGQIVNLESLVGGDTFEFTAGGPNYLVLKGHHFKKIKDNILVADLLDGTMDEFEGAVLVRKLKGEFVY